MDKKKRFIQLSLFTLFFIGLLFALKQTGQREAAALDKSSSTLEAITEREHFIDMPGQSRSKQA